MVFYAIGKFDVIQPGTGTSPTRPGILCLNPFVDDPDVGRPI